MGLSSSTTTNAPWKPAQPYVLGAAANLQDAYTQNAPQIQNATNQVTGLLPSVIQKYQAGNPSINAAQGYNDSVLGGQYLGQGNPYLQQQIDNTNQDVRNQTEAGMGLHGLTGGSSYADVVSRNLAHNDTGLRYQDYTNERANMGQAAGQAPGLAAADTLQINPMMQLLGAANTPVQSAGGYAQSLGGLLGGYGSQTKDPSVADSIGKGIGAVASLFPSGIKLSDARLKTDIRRLGTTDGGLGLYSYRYKWGGPPEIGVLAHEVAAHQPDALGPMVSGYATVNYERVR